MVVVEGLGVGRGIGNVLVGVECMKRVVSDDENQVELVLWACAEYNSMLVV